MSIVILILALGVLCFPNIAECIFPLPPNLPLYAPDQLIVSFNEPFPIPYVLDLLNPFGVIDFNPSYFYFDPTYYSDPWGVAYFSPGTIPIGYTYPPPDTVLQLIDSIDTLGEVVNVGLNAYFYPASSGIAPLSALPTALPTLQPYSLFSPFSGLPPLGNLLFGY